MDKEELTAYLNKAYFEEESATAIYMKHLSAIVHKTELKKELTSDIENLLKRLIQDNKTHRGIVGDMLATLKEDPANDF